MLNIAVSANVHKYAAMKSAIRSPCRHINAFIVNSMLSVKMSAILADRAQKGHSGIDSKWWCRGASQGDQRTVTIPNICHRLAGVFVGAAMLILPGALAAQTSSQSRPIILSMRELARISPTGNYLAARHAGAQRDASAAAAYFRAALRSDPRNGELLERAFLATLAEGEIDRKSVV